MHPLLALVVALQLMLHFALIVLHVMLTDKQDTGSCCNTRGNTSFGRP